MAVRSDDRQKDIDRKVTVPTILVASADEALRRVLILRLRAEGYLVFEAEDEAKAIHTVIVQARAIHILLVDGNSYGRGLAETLKRYRSDMRVIFITSHPEPDGLNPETVLVKVRELLKAPASDALGSSWECLGQKKQATAA